MPNVSIMSQIGSALPAALRAAGHIACWYVLVDGRVMAGPFMSRGAALASESIWRFELGMRHRDTLVA
ncbi:hypothetical protein [Pseudomonas sp. LRF_L74]|uniref:hypothetical protein n=1 Tax=Pseudomonas sp. LRF_L74 TaxID=3369422 RepID=UPI003F63FF16